MLSLSRKGVSPVIAIVLLLMMTVAAAGAAYFWLTSMQSSMQESSRKSIENIMEASGRRVVAQATLCKPTYPYKGLKGYWTFEEESGNKTKDISGNENTGTLYPGSDGSIISDSEMWTDEKIGGALKFDGNDSYVNAGDDKSIKNLINEMTVIVWVKPKEWENNDGIVTKTDNLGGMTEGWGLETYGDGRIIFHTSNTTTDKQVYSTSSLTVGEWDMVAEVYDVNDAGSEAKVYFNGKFEGSRSLSGGLSTTGYDLVIGRETPNYDRRWFNGTIDEVRIYDRALSENEIKELYEAEDHSARRRIDVTVRNIGSKKVPKATWVANLKQDGTTVETDAYNASAIDTGELATLKFYFKNFKPDTEYTIQLQGTGTSTTVSC